jgi:hypothetical protein
MATVGISIDLLRGLIAMSRARSILAYLLGMSASFAARLLALRLAHNGF